MNNFNLISLRCLINERMQRKLFILKIILMSKHRRTKSSDNYYQKNHEFLVKDDDFEYNETKLIIERI